MGRQSIRIVKPPFLDVINILLPKSVLCSTKLIEMKVREIFSRHFTRRNRTYFFDIKESIPGDLYVTISENKITTEGIERYRIMIFNEDLDRFTEMFQEISKKLQEIKELRISQNHCVCENCDHSQGKSYKPWSSTDDEKLESLYCQGQRSYEMAKIFERSRGAIISRIKKLQLEEKYGKGPIEQSW